MPVAYSAAGNNAYYTYNRHQYTYDEKGYKRGEFLFVKSSIPFKIGDLFFDIVYGLFSMARVSYKAFAFGNV